MNNNDEELKKLYEHLIGLSNIERYSRLHIFNKQSVAEHSFNAAIIALYAISKTGGVDYKEGFEVLAATLLHDIEESLTGDIIAPIKKMLNGVNKVEQWSAKRILTEDMKAMWDNSRGKYKHLVKLADTQEMKLFCEYEKTLGNGEPYLDYILGDDNPYTEKVD